MTLQMRESTSAAGAMARAPMPALGVLFWPVYAHADFETTGIRLLPAEAWEFPFSPQTSSGLVPAITEEPTKTGAAIMELRRLSGLTWEQLAQLFGVARRSLHFWASGRPMNGPNEERLRRVLAAVHSVDWGSAADNRVLLLQDRDGVIPLDLLARGEYARFSALVGAGAGRRGVDLTPLSPDAREARKPTPPEELVGALQDRVPLRTGRARAARSVKVRRRAR